MQLKIGDRADRQQRGGADQCTGSEGEDGLEADFHTEAYHESYPISIIT
jgi:hypothetical protein